MQVAEIERTIGVGQVEELIEHAKSELRLIPEYASWKLWEESRPLPQDDEFSEVYDDLEFLDPESVDYLGLRELALKKRAEAESRRKKVAEMK